MGIDKRFPKYSRLLRLYPSDYQKKYKGQMLQTLADMLDDPTNDKMLVWIKAATDLPLSLFKQNLIYAGDIMKNETPHYVKRNLLIEALLLVPFFSLVALNSLSDHALDFTNSWKRFFTWLVIGMPAAALIIGVVTFLSWNAQQGRGFWKSLLDIRRNWLMFLVTGLAFLIVVFIPFHDSSRCVNGNPVRELRNFHDTLHCIEQS